MLASNTTYSQIKLNQHTAELKRSSLEQKINGIRISGFGDSTTILCVIKLDSKKQDIYLSIKDNKNLAFSYGSSSWSNFKELAFTGIESQINHVLSTLTINTTDKEEIIRLKIGVTTNPIGHVYNLQDGSFYKATAGLIDFTSKLTGNQPIFINYSEYSFKIF
jgi:hypothetical protein